MVFDIRQLVISFHELDGLGTHPTSVVEACTWFARDVTVHCGF